ncbi:DNA gyrase inhibitor YacG [Neoroseomonas lacus]|uniref:DNA gyrase inhibitor YacG n=1 Tax=Neoroseomonas lacus TaxID=287609 RepID=UPI0016668B66|nr:DNA gyrase inhibitor YacG [Neoroseomonas lacus]
MADDPKPRPLPRCPICRRPAQAASRPFCSPHCAQVDLGRWLTGSYAIPGEPDAIQDNDEDDT